MIPEIPAAARETATIRPAVRVLLLDEADRLLLFRATNPDTGHTFWLSPGGGIEAGEDLHAAALRELREETGVRQVELGAEVWHRRHVFTWRGVVWDQRERWLLARVAAFEPDLSGMGAEEATEIRDPQWWTAEDIAASNDYFIPRDLGRRLQGLLRDGAPPEPVEIGV